MRITRDAYLVYVQEMKRSADVAETVRVAAEKELSPARRKIHDCKELLGPASAIDMRLLNITAGACAFELQQDFVEAVRRAEDALLRSRQGGDRHVLSSSAT